MVSLARLGEAIFHTSDLANLWEIQNSNTLYTTLKRYVKSGLLFRIQKGLYSLYPPEELDPLLLGIKTIHGYAYISTETVLFNGGIINQRPQSVTLVSSLSLRFHLLGYSYTSRQLNARFLFNSAGIGKQERVLTASVERAAADLLYYNSRVFFDSPELIDWNMVDKLQGSIGYKKTRCGETP